MKKRENKISIKELSAIRMMMEQRRHEKIIGVIFLVPLAILIIILISSYKDKPEYKITKQECWNETTIIGSTLLGYYNETCNQTITWENLVCTSWGCGEWHIAGKECAHEQDLLEYPCSSVLCTYKNDEDFGDGKYVRGYIYIKKENFVMPRDISQPIFKTSQKCEDKEVEEIYEDKYVFHGYTCGQDCKFGEEWYCDYDNGGIDNCGYNHIYFNISKSDLTEEFLQENCECNFEHNNCEEVYKIQNPPYWYCSLKNGATLRTVIKDCFKYKCSDYKVEVIK